MPPERKGYLGEEGTESPLLYSAVRLRPTHLMTRARLRLFEDSWAPLELCRYSWVQSRSLVSHRTLEAPIRTSP